MAPKQKIPRYISASYIHRKSGVHYSVIRRAIESGELPVAANMINGTGQERPLISDKDANAWLRVYAKKADAVARAAKERARRASKAGK